MNLITIFLQSSVSPGMINLLFFGMIFLVFYFFMIRPQAKKQKEQTNFQEAMEKGDEVVTSSGILGKINRVEDNIITLEVGNKTYIRVTRGSISKEMTDAVFAAPPEKTTK
jgi:preprotein translocase subunit YajC